MERVVHNLIGNAIRYVSDGGVVRARASLADDGETLTIAIGNNGRPIDPAVQPTIFEKYITSGDRKKRRGMGLYFCRLACEAHGGSIGIEPVPDFPATFVVRVPAKAAAVNALDNGERRAS
jgi:signal transduction histidine kinase